MVDISLLHWLSNYATHYLACWVFTLRAAKGSALTHAELDANFSSLQDTANAANGDALIGVKLSATGSAARTQHAKNADIVSVKDFGAVGDGITNDSAAIKAAMEAVQATGAKLYCPTGTYSIGTVVNPAMTADLEVECDAGANFVATAVLNNRLFFFNKTSAGDISFRWRGGRTDMSLVGLGGAGTAWDHFTVSEKFDVIRFEDVEIFSGTDYNTNHADSGIFAVGRRISIKHCRFQGIWDAAIYLSGDSAQANGEDAVVDGCSFLKCLVGVISKRQFLRYAVANNFFDRCGTGIATGEADTTLLAGKNNIIVGNQIVQPASIGIQTVISDGTIIADNRIEDQGYDLADALVVAGSNGIRLAGSADCIVNGNWVGMRRFATGGSGHRGIQLERRTYNAVNYDSLRNIVANNRIVGINVGIREEDVNQDVNRILFNVISGATTRIVKNGAASFYAEFNTESANRLDLVGTVSLGGVFGSESFRVNPVVGAVDFLSVSGSTAGAPILQGIGASANVDIRLLPKGAGVVRYGAFTVNADAPVTGYVTIKSDDGISRKLATIA